MASKAALRQSFDEEVQKIKETHSAKEIQKTYEATNDNFFVSNDYQELAKATITQLGHMETTFEDLNKRFALGIKGLEGKVIDTGKTKAEMNHLEKLADAALAETKKNGEYYKRASIIKDFTKRMEEVRDKMIADIKADFEKKLQTIDEADAHVMKKIQEKTTNSDALTSQTEDFEGKKWYTFTAASNPLPIDEVVKTALGKDGLGDDVIVFDYSQATDQRIKDYAKQHSPDYPKAYLKKGIDQRGKETLVIIGSDKGDGKQYRGWIREGVKMSTDKSAVARNKVALTHKQEVKKSHEEYQKHFDAVQDLQGAGIHLERADAELLMKSIDTRLQYFINQCRNLGLTPNTDDVMTELERYSDTGLFEFHATYSDGTSFDQYFLKNEHLTPQIMTTLKEGDNKQKLLGRVKNLWHDRYNKQVLQGTEKQTRVHMMQETPEGTSKISETLDIAFESSEQAQRAKQYIYSEFAKVSSHSALEDIPTGHEPFYVPMIVSSSKKVGLMRFDDGNFRDTELFMPDNAHEDIRAILAEEENRKKLTNFMNSLFAKKYQEQINKAMETSTGDTFAFEKMNKIDDIQTKVEGLMRNISDLGKAHSGRFGGLSELQKAQVAWKENQINEGINRIKNLLHHEHQALKKLQAQAQNDPTKKPTFDDAKVNFETNRQRFLDIIQHYNEIASRTGGDKSGISNSDQLEALTTRGREDMSFAIQHIKYEIARENTPEKLLQFLWKKMSSVSDNYGKTDVFISASREYIHALEQEIFQKIQAMNITPETKKKHLLLLADICRDDVSGKDIASVGWTGIDNNYKNYPLAQKIMQALFLGQGGVAESMNVKPTHQQTETMSQQSRKQLFDKFSVLGFKKPTWAAKKYADLTTQQRVHLASLDEMLRRFPDIGSASFVEKFAANPAHYGKMMKLTIMHTAQRMMKDFTTVLTNLNEYAGNLGLQGLNAEIYEKFVDMKGIGFDFSDETVDTAQQGADMVGMLVTAIGSSIAAGASLGAAAPAAATSWAVFAGSIVGGTLGSMAYDVAVHGKARETSSEFAQETGLTFAMDGATLGMLKGAGKVITTSLGKLGRSGQRLVKALDDTALGKVISEGTEMVTDFGAGIEGERRRQKWLYNINVDVKQLIEQGAYMAALGKIMPHLPQYSSLLNIKNPTGTQQATAQLFQKNIGALQAGIKQTENDLNAAGKQVHPQDATVLQKCKAWLKNISEKLGRTKKTNQEKIPTGRPKQTGKQKVWERMQLHKYGKERLDAQRCFAGRETSQLSPILQRFIRGDDIHTFSQGDIKTLQKLVGHNERDGVLGPKTFAAIKKFAGQLETIRLDYGFQYDNILAKYVKKEGINIRSAKEVEVIHQKLLAFLADRGQTNMIKTGKIVDGKMVYELDSKTETREKTRWMQVLQSFILIDKPGRVTIDDLMVFSGYYKEIYNTNDIAKIRKNLQATLHDITKRASLKKVGVMKTIDGKQQYVYYYTFDELRSRSTQGKLAQKQHKLKMEKDAKKQQEANKKGQEEESKVNKEDTTEKTTQTVNDLEAEAKKATTPQKMMNVMRKIGTFIASSGVPLPLGLLKKLSDTTAKLYKKIKQSFLTWREKRQAEETMKKAKRKMEEEQKRQKVAYQKVLKDFENLAQLLGLDPKKASENDVKNVAREKFKTHHPDKGGDKETFNEYKEAYDKVFKKPSDEMNRVFKERENNKSNKNKENNENAAHTNMDQTNGNIDNISTEEDAKKVFKQIKDIASRMASFGKTQGARFKALVEKFRKAAKRFPSLTKSINGLRKKVAEFTFMKAYNDATIESIEVVNGEVVIQGKASYDKSGKTIEVEGTFTKFRKNGILLSQGTIKQYNKDGSIDIYKQGKFDHHGRIQGQGTKKLYFEDSSVIETGMFVNSSLSGKGTFQHLDKNRNNEATVSGIWEEGILKEGSGKQIFSNGLYEEGTWKNGKLHGKNCKEQYKTETGHIALASGTFENGNLIEGVINVEDRMYREGTFEDGRLHGGKCKKTIIRPEWSKVLSGKFEKGILIDGVETITTENGTETTIIGNGYRA